MWLVTTSVAAVGATVARFVLPKKYNLGFLALMFWGSTVMILTDRILGYGGGAFLEKTTDGMIANATVLGIVMMLPVILSWIVSLLAKKEGK